MTANRRLLAKLQKIFGTICLACETTPSQVIDHVIPLSRDGADCFCNLQPLCAYCNSRKGGTIAEYRPSTIRFSDADADLARALSQYQKATKRTESDIIRAALEREIAILKRR